jgi:hypothetical protein
MGVIFTAAEVDAQQFVEMQAAAKLYMLDPRYPERAECIGGKGRNAENDHMKLRLFNTVARFLENEGWGEKCYGSKAPGTSERELKWPEMREK